MAALHEVDTEDASGIEDCYSTALAARDLPKRRMPAGASPPGAVRDLILDELALDGNASQNLATSLFSWPNWSAVNHAPKTHSC